MSYRVFLAKYRHRSTSEFSRLIVRKEHAWRVLVLVCFCISSLGCEGQNDHEEQSVEHSHAGHSHDVAEHWPRDLLDLKFKLRGRMDKWRANDGDRGKLQEQIVDLIQWTPEIAADTDLSESQWLPIYENTQELIQLMDDSDGVAKAFDSLRFTELFDNLCVQLQDAAKTLPSSFRRPGAKF